MTTPIGPLPASVLPAGMRARILPGINGLDMHVLEAGFETPGRPAVLLLQLSLRRLFPVHTEEFSLL